MVGNQTGTTEIRTGPSLTGLSASVPLVGEPAPDFALASAWGDTVTLSKFRGRRAVLVVFYPFAFSEICTAELDGIRDSLPDFVNGSVQLLAVSTDPKFALAAYGRFRGYTFPLLSDFWPHGAVASVYGVFDQPRGMAVRGTFLIDLDGTLRFSEVNAPGDVRDQQGWKDAIGRI